MKTFHTPAYEAALDGLIENYGTRKVADELIKSLQELCESDSSVDLTHKYDRVKSKMSYSDKKVKVHISALKSLLTSSIIHQLENKLANDQAIIVYKYLTNAYTLEPEDLPEVEKGIIEIQTNKSFPIDELTRSKGQDGKYRAFSNLFINQQVAPSKHTLKFGMAILN